MHAAVQAHLRRSLEPTEVSRPNVVAFKSAGTRLALHTGGNDGSDDGGDGYERDICVTVKLFEQAAHLVTSDDRKFIGFERWVASESDASEHIAQVNRLMTRVFTLLHSAPKDFVGMAMRIEVSRQIRMPYFDESRVFMLEDSTAEVVLPEIRPGSPRLESFRDEMTDTMIAIIRDVAHGFPGPGG